MSEATLGPLEQLEDFLCSLKVEGTHGEFREPRPGEWRNAEGMHRAEHWGYSAALCQNPKASPHAFIVAKAMGRHYRTCGARGCEGTA